MQAPREYTKNVMSVADAAEILPKMIAAMSWKTGEIVLDYGCGPGRTAFRHILPTVENNNSTMISVDCSETVVEYAKQHFPHERITYYVGDVLDQFPFEECTFDKAFAFYVFHFVGDLRRALVGLRNALKPGGQLGFSTFLARMLYFKVFRILLETHPWSGFMKDCKKFFPTWSLFEDEDCLASISKLITDCGFTINHLEIETRSWTFDNTEDGIDLFMSVTPNLLLPPTQVSSFKKDYRRIMTQILGITCESKGFTFPYDVVVGVVQKPLEDQQ